MRPAASRRPWRLERRDAGVPASKLRCERRDPAGHLLSSCPAACPTRPPWRAGLASALASALLRRAASRAAVVTASRRAAAILESTTEEVSTVDCRAQAVRALASALQACSPEMEASRLASLEATVPQKSVGHLQRRDPCHYVMAAVVL